MYTGERIGGIGPALPRIEKKRKKKKNQEAVDISNEYFHWLLSEEYPQGLLTRDQTRKLTSAVQQKNVDRIAVTYEKHRQMLPEDQRGKAWQDLTPSQRTVITSVGFQHGHNSLRKADESGNRKPMNFIKEAAQNDWGAMLTNLRDFKDQFGTRRDKEANYLATSQKLVQLPSDPMSFIG